jgi:uncharacterized protein (DUF952 family)
MDERRVLTIRTGVGFARVEALGMAVKVAYKVLTPADVNAMDAGVFEGAPIDIADGYIHLSTAEQLTETVRRHFAGQTHLTLAAVDLAALGGMVRWEVSRDGQRFPHVYGRLTPASIIALGPLEWGADGLVLLPSVLS